MKRREFITGLASAATMPVAGRAQQKVPRIGVLMMYAESSTEAQGWVSVLRSRLQNLGWHDGRNFKIDYRWTAANLNSVQRSAKELIALQPEMIFSSSTLTTAALMQETRTIPIVFGNIADPVSSGFVASLSRPGGNVTGFVNFEASTGGKFLELLKEVVPGVKTATMIFNPSASPYAEIYLSPFRFAAASLGVEPTIAAARDLTEFEAVISKLASEPNSGLTVVPDAYWIGRTAQIASLTARYRVPAVLYSRLFSQAGCLLSYGNDIQDNYWRAAAYIDRILKGTKPSELPVQFPTKFELVINLRTAKTLGVVVPPSLLVRADDLIE